MGDDAQKRSRYMARTLNQLQSLDRPKKSFLVDGMLVNGSSTLLAAREKAGKGLLEIDLAVCVATGEPFLGRAILREGPVIILALEESIDEIIERLESRTPNDPDVPVYIVSLDGSLEAETFQLEENADLIDIKLLIEELGAVLVIIDPLREAHSGREHDSDDMAPRVRPIRSLAHSMGVSILVAHHADKVNGTSRGSTAIRGGFDNEITFTRTDLVSESEIRGDLVGGGRGIAKFYVRAAFDPSTFRWSPSDEPEVVDPSLRNRILAILENSNEWLTAVEIASLLSGPPLKTVQNVVSRMRKERPKPFAERGGGTRSDPRAFHTLAPGMNLGTVVDLHVPHRLWPTGTDDYTGEVAF